MYRYINSDIKINEICYSDVVLLQSYASVSLVMYLSSQTYIKFLQGSGTCLRFDGILNDCFIANSVHRVWK